MKFAKRSKAKSNRISRNIFSKKKLINFPRKKIAREMCSGADKVAKAMSAIL